MGQLLGMPSLLHTTGAEVDHVSAVNLLRPKTLFECIVNGKLQARRYQEYRKRSWEESEKLVGDLLCSRTSCVDEQNQEDDEESAAITVTERQQVLVPVDAAIAAPAAKKRRQAKQVVMYTDPHTGERHRLHPTMSNW